MIFAINHDLAQIASNHNLALNLSTNHDLALNLSINHDLALITI